MDDSSILRRRGLQVRISLLLKHKSSSGFLKFTGIKGRTLRIWLEVIDLVNGSRKECRQQNTFRLFSYSHFCTHSVIVQSHNWTITQLPYHTSSWYQERKHTNTLSHTLSNAHTIHPGLSNFCLVVIGKWRHSPENKNNPTHKKTHRGRITCHFMSDFWNIIGICNLNNTFEGICRCFSMFYLRIFSILCVFPNFESFGGSQLEWY